MNKNQQTYVSANCTLIKLQGNKVTKNIQFQNLDTYGVTEIVEIIDTMNGTHIMDVQDIKEPERRSLYKQETTSYPSLVDQAEELHRNIVSVTVTKIEWMFPTNNEALTTDLTITTNEKHEESNRALDANVRIEEDSICSTLYCSKRV